MDWGAYNVRQGIRNKHNGRFGASPSGSEEGSESQGETQGAKTVVNPWTELPLGKDSGKSAEGEQHGFTGETDNGTECAREASLERERIRASLANADDGTQTQVKLDVTKTDIRARTLHELWRLQSIRREFDEARNMGDGRLWGKDYDESMLL